MADTIDSKWSAKTGVIFDAAETGGVPVIKEAANLPLKQDIVDPYIDTIFEGKYRIDRKIGEGGMGVVYQATHIFIERPVAIKFLRSDYEANNQVTERFKLEARAAGRIQHPNITAILDFGYAENHFYLVMEYLEGETLRQRLRSHGPLSVAEMFRIINQVCGALDAAHKSKIIHRDLKPENIFLQQKDGREIVKVLDFGIAKFLQSPVGELTTEAMLGTPYYMSPEQCQSDPLGATADIYTLGVIIFEMLTGRLPFTGETPLVIAYKHLKDAPPSLRDYCNDLPEELDKVVARALAKSSEARPQSALDLLAELEIALAMNGEETLINHNSTKHNPMAKCANSACSAQQELDNQGRCPSCQSLPIGALVRHRYQVDKLVGKGGFGTTYLVTDTDCFNERRILKELCPYEEEEEDQDLVRNTAERLFKREAMVLLNVQHPGIPKLYAYFTEGIFTYLVQDFIPGQTLAEELKKRSKPFSESEAISILSELADILDYLHNCSTPIIHRDIKPQNLMRHSDGQVMLIDFGAVCHAANNPDQQTVIGSLGYAPPEQFSGQTVPQSDLYAAGATVVYLLSGIPPRLMLNGKPDLEKELQDKASKEFVDILGDLLTPELSKRLPSAGELKKRLRAMKQPQTSDNAGASAGIQLVPVISATPATPTAPATPPIKPVSEPTLSVSLVIPPATPTQRVEPAKPAQSAQPAQPSGQQPGQYRRSNSDNLQRQDTRSVVPPTSVAASNPAPPTQPPAMAAGFDFQQAAAFCYEVELTLSSFENANYYAILNVDRDATDIDIRKAYLGLAEKFNPNRHEQLASFNKDLRANLEKIYQRVQTAYNVLSNKKQRDDYNRHSRSGRFEAIKR